MADALDGDASCRNALLRGERKGQGGGRRKKTVRLYRPAGKLRRRPWHGRARSQFFRIFTLAAADGSIDPQARTWYENGTIAAFTLSLQVKNVPYPPSDYALFKVDGMTLRELRRSRASSIDDRFTALSDLTKQFTTLRTKERATRKDTAVSRYIPLLQFGYHTGQPGCGRFPSCLLVRILSVTSEENSVSTAAAIAIVIELTRRMD